jgi:hypothetical protein
MKEQKELENKGTTLLTKSVSRRFRTALSHFLRLLVLLPCGKFPLFQFLRRICND